MKKKLFILAVLLCSCFALKAQKTPNPDFDFSAVCSTGQTLYYKIIDADNLEVKIVPPIPTEYAWDYYERPSGEITLPATVEYNGQDYKVKKIGRYAFFECSGLTGSLNMPQFVDEIEFGAFAYCTGFNGTLSLENVNTIKEFAFEGCSGFKGSLNVQSHEVRLSAFRYCSGFDGTLTIGDFVSLGEDAFSGCKGFTKLVLPEIMQNIGAKVFQNCSGFSGPLDLPRSLSSIGSFAFQGCSGFTGSLVIPSYVHSIGESAFENCTGFIGTLTIPESVETIGKKAFLGCHKFVEVFNHSSLDIVKGSEENGYAAYYALAVKTSGSDESEVINCGDFVFYEADGTVYLVGYTGNATQLTLPVECFDSYVIKDYAFSNYKQFEGSLVIPNIVTSIGQHAFEGCSGFTGSLVIPNSVTSIGNDAFAYCTGFTGSLTLSDNLTHLGNSAFCGCEHFTGSLTIPESLASIGQVAFSEGGFDGTLTLPNSITEISRYAFKNCGFTEPLVIPNSVKDIQEGAFWGCSSLTGNLTIPNSVTSIGFCSFSGCTSSGEVLTIGSSVSYIDDYAFENTGFTTVILKPITPPEWNHSYSPFGGTTAIEYIYVPCGSASAYESADWGEFCSEGLRESVLFELQLSSSNEDYGSAVYDHRPYYCEDGMEVTVTATPYYSNVVFLNWTVNGRYASSDNPYTFELNTDMDVVANFARPRDYVYEPVVSIPSTPNPDAVYVLGYCIGENYFLHESGTGEGQMKLALNPENPVEYSLSSETDYGIAQCGDTYLGVSESGVSLSDFDSDNCHLTIQNGNISSVGAPQFTIFHDDGIIESHENSTVGNLCFFERKNLYQIYISSSPAEGGTVTATCGGEPVQAAPAGSTITLTATPYGINEFVGWTENGVLVSDENPYVFTLESTRDFVANFNLVGQYDFTAVCPTGQTLYYKITDADSRNVRIVAPKSNDSHGWDGCAKPSGNIVLPETVTNEGISYTMCEIGNYAFSGCTGLTGALAIPSSVTNIGDGAFWRCSGFNGALTIPNSVTSIGANAFFSCVNFTGSLTIPNSVTEIGTWAFYNCQSLSDALILGNSVEEIGNYAFVDCAFSCIVSKAQTAPNLNYEIPDATRIVYIPSGAMESYQNSNWGRDEYDYTFIEYDREDYHFNGTGSEWNTAANWEENEVPSMPCHNVFVNADCIFDATGDNASVHSVNIAAGKTLTITEDNTLTADFIILEDGAQLANYGMVACNDITVKKAIEGYGTGAGNWHLVSSPVTTTSLPVGMATTPAEDYDLYRFSQTGDSQDREWLNYKAGAFQIENQRGYLYANKNNTMIVFRGGFASANVKPLAYDENAEFAGFNLVGNPYPCNATISGTNLRSSNYFYMMNANGTDLEVVANPVLAPCTGVFAVAANSDATVTFTQASGAANVTRGEKSSLQDIRVELLADGKVIDRAYLNMNGESLPKFSLQDNASEICFYQDKEELAAVSTSSTSGEMPVSFKAAKNGSYTITVNTENVEAEYLHLIDNLTGADVDLLATASTGSASYTFDAKTSDYASRFKLVFGVKDETSEASENFAYISNGEIIVSNEGRATLQVIDVLGRIVSSEEINGDCRISTNGLTAGVYVLNLNGKTQKIVVE